MRRPKNSDWFVPRRVADGVWRVSEPGHINSWLVEGTDKAALIDTGLGLFSIREECEKLTDKPVGVVNTHSHFDHIGGNTEFDDVAIHRDGVAEIATSGDDAMLRRYLEMMPRMHEESRSLALKDRESFSFLMTPDELVRELPGDCDLDSWHIPAVEASRSLSDGDAVDLGDRVLRVTHTPGHNPDSICLLLEDEGIMFTGDTVVSGVIVAHMEDSDLDAFVRSTARLAEMEGDVRLLCMGHHLRPVAEAAFLSEVAEAFAAIAAGETVAVPAEDDFGYPALLVEHGRVMVYLRDEARAPSGEPTDQEGVPT